MPPHPMRRSTRVSWRVRVRMSGVDRNQPFAEDCETLVVNLHGCALQSTRPLKAGTPIQLEVARSLLRGRIIDAVPLTDDQSRWMLGIALEQAGNHWGIQYPPEDWGPSPAPAQEASADSAPRQVQPAPGPVIGGGAIAHASVNREKVTEINGGSRPTGSQSHTQSQPTVERDPGPPAPVTSAVQQSRPVQPDAVVPKAPPAPANDAALQEIRAQLVQLQQAQAKQEAMLLQERSERQAARTQAEQAIADQLERVRQAKEYVESLVCSFPSIIEAQAQEQSQAIIRRLQPQVSRADIEKLVRETQQGNEAALEQRAAQLLDDLRQKLEQPAEERRQAADAAHAAAAHQLQELEERANHLTALVDVELQKHAEEVIAEAVAEIRKELDQRPPAPQQPAPVEVDPGLQALVAHAQEITAELRQTLKAVQQEHRMNEAATARLHHRSESVQAWLVQETDKFQQSLREAFLDAGGEIRGRIAQAVETAAEPVEARGRELQEQMASLARRHVEELHRHVDVACDRLESCSDQARAAIAADMQARVSEALDSFTRDAQHLAQVSVERWQSAVTQTLAAIPKLLADNLSSER